MPRCWTTFAVLAAATVAAARMTTVSYTDEQKCMSRSPETKIVGGEEVTPGELPYMVSIQNNQWNSERHYCGGSIYNSNTIITAAHCLTSVGVDILQVVAGEHDRTVVEGSEQKVPVTQTIVHPGYSSLTYQNDIALLRLAHDLIFDDYVQPIQLPNEGTVLSGMCMVAGWGATEEFGDVVNVPYKTNVPVWSDDQCRGVYSVEEIYDSMVCAGYEEGGKDSCHSDSGGPLTCYDDTGYFLGGVVSWGYGCARAFCPSVYTELAHFLPWIFQSETLMYNNTLLYL